MTDSNRVTELNQRSLALTDAELAFVERFSVLLPMNELPEIVVSGDSSANGDHPEPAEGSERTIIPFPSAVDRMEGRSTKNVPTKNESDDSGNGQKQNSTNANSTSKPLDDEAVTVEFPQDELSISRNSDSEEACDEECDGDSENKIADEAVFDIAEHGKYHERLEPVAKSVEQNLDDSQSNVVVLASPCNTVDQDIVFNSLMMGLASRNPDWKMIAVQGVEPEIEMASFSVGLGHVLSEEYLLEDVVIPTSVDNLDYLAYSPSDLSSSSYRNRIGRVLDELKKHYDLVFINGNEASSLTTQGLASSADSFYLLIRLMDSEREAVVNAVDLLRRKGARLAGCILSDYEREAS